MTLSHRSALETDLKIEREWRGTLQRNLEQEKERVASLQEDVGVLHIMKKVSTIQFNAPIIYYLYVQNTVQRSIK